MGFESVIICVQNSRNAMAEMGFGAGSKDSALKYHFKTSKSPKIELGQEKERTLRILVYSPEINPKQSKRGVNR